MYQFIQINEYTLWYSHFKILNFNKYNKNNSDDYIACSDYHIEQFIKIINEK